MRHDFRSAIRQIRRQPFFALAIVTILGSSMGVNSALFSIFNATMLRPWAVKDAARVVVVHASALTGPEVRYWTEHVTTLSDVVTIRRSLVAWTGGQRLGVHLVSTNYFDGMSVPMQRGTVFGDAERDPSRANVAIISHRTWDELFGRAEDILERQLALNGRSFRIVGVAASGFDGSWSEMRRA